MKFHLTKLALNAGLGLVMLSIASEAEAGLFMNDSSLTGQTTEKQPSQQQSHNETQKTRQQKPFVQIEWELTEAQLEAIAF